VFVSYTKAELCLLCCRCRLVRPPPNIHKAKNYQPRHKLMSGCHMGLVSYAPTQAEVSVAEAPSPSAIEQQLALQHQHPAQLLPLQRLENSLLIDDDISLLDGLMRTTSVTPHSAGGAILGFEVANGAVAAKDFPVGKVQSTTNRLCIHSERLMK
jgi:hypothetical protein